MRCRFVRSDFARGRPEGGPLCRNSTSLRCKALVEPDGVFSAREVVFLYAKVERTVCMELPVEDDVSRASEGSQARERIGGAREASQAWMEELGRG